jgi:hypothetical protein
MMVSEEPERVWKEGVTLEEVRKTTGNLQVRWYSCHDSN